jgi:starch synthase (maltosyl-transferring)
MNQHRVVIENVRPQLACGSFFVKWVVGESVHVTASILPDGHDVIQAEVLYRHEKERKFRDVRMEHLGQDEYEATFIVEKQGFYETRCRAG